MEDMCLTENQGTGNLIISEGEHKKEKELFVTKKESIFFHDFLAFPIYTKYLDHCVAN